MILPIKEILAGKTYRRGEQENNVIYLGKRKFINEKDEVKEFDAIMMKNTISEQSWIWNPSHKDLIADD